MRYEYRKVKFQKGMFGANISEHRDIINEMSDKGYRYVGWIPTKIFGYGNIDTVELIFEKEG